MLVFIGCRQSIAPEDKINQASDMGIKADGLQSISKSDSKKAMD